MKQGKANNKEIFMACYIHSFAEKKNQDGSYKEIQDIKPFYNDQFYGTFTFLAGVRNYYSNLIPIAEPRGIPENATETVKAKFIEWDCDAHTPSWLSLKELEEFNYDLMLHCEGKHQTYREFLGTSFFDDIKKLKEENVDRIIFWFEN